MGHRSNPNILRLGFLKNWSNLWFTGKTYYKLFHQDLFIRRYVKALFRIFGFQILRIGIKRNIKSIFVTVTVFNWNKKPSELLTPYLANIKWWFADNVFHVIVQRFAVAVYKLSGVVDVRMRLQYFHRQTSSIEKIIRFANPLLFAKYIIRNHRRMYSAKKSIKILRSTFKELPLNFSLIKGLRIQVSGPLKAPRQRRSQTYKYILAGPVPLQTFVVNTLYTVMSRVLSEGLVTTKIWMRRPAIKSVSAKRHFFYSVAKRFLNQFKGFNDFLFTEIQKKLFRGRKVYTYTKYWPHNLSDKHIRVYRYDPNASRAKISNVDLFKLVKSRHY